MRVIVDESNDSMEEEEEIGKCNNNLTLNETLFLMQNLHIYF